MRQAKLVRHISFVFQILVLSIGEIVLRIGRFERATELNSGPKLFEPKDKPYGKFSKITTAIDG
jgi:hypothetical protein